MTCSPLHAITVFFAAPLPLPSFPQPPLQFYTKIIANKQWDDISVLTYAKTDELINPTYTALEEMKATGILGPNVKFFKVGGGVSPTTHLHIYIIYIYIYIFRFLLSSNNINYRLLPLGNPVEYHDKCSGFVFIAYVILV